MRVFTVLVSNTLVKQSTIRKEVDRITSYCDTFVFLIIQSTKKNMEMIKLPFVAQCVLDLVLNSVNEHSSCIAIRVYKNELQIIDNGIGISVNALMDIEGANKNNNHDLQSHCNLRNNTLMTVYKHFSIVAISSRCRDSMETYTKVYKAGSLPNLLKTVLRPSSGTTVIVYDYLKGMQFNEENISVICFLIASISLNNPKISFTIRDEYNIFLKITKDNNPMEVLKLLYKEHSLHDFIWNITCTTVSTIQYHGYIGLIKNQEKTIHYIFLNNRPMYCPTLINGIFNHFNKNLNFYNETYSIQKQMMFLMFFINCPSIEFVVTMKNSKELVLLYKIRDILDSIRHYINSMFLNEFFLKKLHECIYYHIPKQEQTIHTFKEFQKVHSVLPLFFYELDCFHKNNEAKKSILYSTNINHNPITVFCTKYGMYIYESKNRKRSKENFISDVQYNIAHAKTNTCIKRKLEEQNIILNQDSHHVKKNDFFNISSNFSPYFSLKENIDLINCVSHTPVSTAVSRNTIFSVRQEYINLEEKPNQLENSQKLHTPECNSYEEDYNCSLSEWSNWSYYPNSAKNTIKMQNSLITLERKNESSEKYYNFFDFLPEKLNNLLKFKSIKLTKILSLSNIDKDVPSIELPYNQGNIEQHEDIDIHPCASMRHFGEFKLKKTALKYVKVLNQVNNQLIAALMSYDNIKLLLMMDQHAVHERIRYENLLIDYKTLDQKSFLSKKLPIPIVIEVTIDMCTMLISNKILLHKFGITLSAMNENTLYIYTVPKCFIKNKHYYNNEKLAIAIRNLLNEILDSIINKKGVNILPLSIHNAISLEACHGAIKFGESLSLKQCVKLFNDLKNTKSPTRCAHGRPSIIPVIELSELRRKCYNNMKKKLNLGSLKSSH